MSLVFAWDARGHGRSPGERGAAADLADMIKDVDAFVRHISERYEHPGRKHDRAGAQPRRGHGERVGARLRAADSRS